MRSSLRCLLPLAALTLACPTAAQPAQPAKPAAEPAAAPVPPVPASRAVAPRPPRAAIARVAEALAREIERVAGERRALVAAAPLSSDTPAPRSAQLAASIATQLAGRLGSGVHPRVEPAALPAARDAARSDAALIHLTIEIAEGHLRVTADVYPVPRTVWARLRDPEPGPVAHAFAEAAIDAEVRAFLAPVPLVAATIERAKNFEGDVVALACGDLDADGALEILSVSRRRITLLRLRAGRVAPLASRSWPDVVGVHPTPLREPLGFATVVLREQDGELLPPFADVGITDRARSVRLDGALGVAAEFSGLAIPDGGGTACTRVWGLLISGPLGPCDAGDPLPSSLSVGGQVDAIASAQLLSARGEPFSVWAARERGVIELRDDSGRRQVVGAAGAQLAVGDLDQDGDPEILTSLDVQNPLDDGVIVWSWPRRLLGTDRSAAHARPPSSSADKPHELLRVPVPAGVRALAVCPPDGPGRAPFAVATADEIWVVR